MSINAIDPEADRSGQRLDKWLWFARVVKTRTLAANLVVGGKVRVNRERVEKPSHSLRPGAVVTVSVNGRVRVLKVLAPGVRRGPPADALELYEELTPQSATLVPGASEPGPGEGHRDRGAGRPTKRDRRRIERFKADTT